jgi:hypothetical protein
MRVPLLYPSLVVISRLDIQSTRRVDPDGAGPITGGYDPDLREPYVYSAGTEDAVKTDTRRYLPAIRVPCQVEVKDFEEVRQKFGGDAPVTQMTFVLHVKDLRRLGYWLTDAQCERGGGPSLKTNDRIDRVETMRQPGVVAYPLKEPLYIYELEPGSWGMGPSGQDLVIVWTANRPALPEA